MTCSVSMYHYVIRTRGCITDNSFETTTYCDYTLYKSKEFNNIQDMLTDYKRQLLRYGLIPNPMFFCNNVYLNNSDNIFYDIHSMETDIDTLLQIFQPLDVL